jgi:hypothetical protein
MVRRVMAAAMRRDVGAIAKGRRGWKILTADKECAMVQWCKIKTTNA